MICYTAALASSRLVHFQTRDAISITKLYNAMRNKSLATTLQEENQKFGTVAGFETIIIVMSKISICDGWRAPPLLPTSNHDYARFQLIRVCTFSPRVNYTEYPMRCDPYNFAIIDYDCKWPQNRSHNAKHCRLG